MSPAEDNTLVRKGLVSAERLNEAMGQARQRGCTWLRILVDAGDVDESSALEALSRERGLDFVDLSDLTIASDAIESLSSRLAAHYQVIPVSIDNGVLKLAVADPLDHSSLDDLQAAVGKRILPVVSTRRSIQQALHNHYGLAADTVAQLVGALPSDEGRVTRVVGHEMDTQGEDASVISLVNQFIEEAVRDRTTDIHFEVYRGEVTARRRIDGVLVDTPIPKDIGQLYPAMVSRIKLMGGLNIVEKRLPQDGRARVHVDGHEFDLRISVVPSLHGENVVMRILPTSMMYSLEDLGLGTQAQRDLRRMIAKPHGIIFVTGPTGSGKSTTLYACLMELNTRERKIITIEDPVEYELKGTTQTQINPRIGLSFATALRSMLRHDPDVMMVGEVRDRETAEITIQTALTGHMVLSTLHTNSAAAGAVRLMDMGVDPYLIASTVLAFAAQRLVRVLCEECKTENTAGVSEAAGCKSCNHTGYRGRMAIYELLPVTREIRELILVRASAADIHEAAVSGGMTTLADDGYAKAADGRTTREEIARVTQLEA